MQYAIRDDEKTTTLIDSITKDPGDRERQLDHYHNNIITTNFLIFN